MTKSNLINRMCEAYKVPVGRAEQIVNAIFDAIEQALNRGERVEIRGFGSFEVRDYKGYVGRNPRTGSTVEVKPKRLAFFKVGKELKDRVQRGALADQGAGAVRPLAADSSVPPSKGNAKGTHGSASTGARKTSLGQTARHASAAGPHV